jgi:hypothetical protein
VIAYLISTTTTFTVTYDGTTAQQPATASTTASP